MLREEYHDALYDLGLSRKPERLQEYPQGLVNLEVLEVEIPAEGGGVGNSWW